MAIANTVPITEPNASDPVTKTWLYFGTKVLRQGKMRLSAPYFLRGTPHITLPSCLPHISGSDRATNKWRDASVSGEPENKRAVEVPAESFQARSNPHHSGIQQPQSQRSVADFVAQKVEERRQTNMLAPLRLASSGLATLAQTSASSADQHQPAVATDSSSASAVATPVTCAPRIGMPGATHESALTSTASAAAPQLLSDSDCCT